MALADALAVVSFKAGPWRLAVEARQVDGMLGERPEVTVAIETLLGLPVAEGATRRCLRLGKHRVTVGEPLALRSLLIDQIHPLPELVAARMRIKGARGLALEADGVTLLIDLRAVLAQNEEDIGLPDAARE